MIERTLAKRYARALLAVTENVEDVEGSLLSLKEVYRTNDAFRRALHEPRIPRSKRMSLLRKPFEGKLGKPFEEFLDLLVDKHRVDLIPDIADAFDRLADASRGVVRVQVRSWKPLDSKMQATLQAKLVEITKRKVEMDVQTDPSLKGGMLVKIGDTVIDGSVASRLKELRERLMERQKTL